MESRSTCPTARRAPVYRRQYVKLWNGPLAVFYTDGAEYDARAKDKPADVADFGERFRILADAAPDAVPLHRVLYNGGNSFDVLAAGEPRYQRALHQGNQPVWSVTWPGLTAKTTLVVEALDQGCPFPGGYISSSHAAADSFNYPSLTLDEARISTGEVFINGQHDPANRPRPIARGYVDVEPAAHPKMDWFEGFDPRRHVGAVQGHDRQQRRTHSQEQQMGARFLGLHRQPHGGPAARAARRGLRRRRLELQHEHGAAGGQNRPQSRRLFARAHDVRGPLHRPSLSAIDDHHDPCPQSRRRAAARQRPPSCAARSHCLSTRGCRPGEQVSIVVQPFAGYHELQIQLCDQRGWGVSAQCPQANIYGDHAGNYNEQWSAPWLPVPVMGEVAGFDRPVQFDVYASTERVYVFMDDRPAGCAVLPAGRFPAGAVNVAFRGVLYHSGIDESVVPDDSGHQYLQRYSLSHFDRHMDDFGIDLSVPAPAWNEEILPCGTRWYGGG